MTVNPTWFTVGSRQNKGNISGRIQISQEDVKALTAGSILEIEPALRGSLLLGTEDMGYFSKYLALNSTSLKINVTAPSGGSLEVLLPRVVFTGQISSVTGEDGGVRQDISFLALKEDGLGTDIKMTLVNNQPQV